MKKSRILALIFILAAWMVILNFPHIAMALDINLDGIGSVSTGAGTAKLNKALGILDVIQSTWFTVLNVIAVLVLAAGAFVLKNKAPDAWSRYFHYLLAVGLALAAPLIVSIITQVVNSLK